MTEDVSTAAKPLPPEVLYTACDVGELPFETTADLDPVDDVVGQDRAAEAVRFAVGIKHRGYNLFALGPANQTSFFSIPLAAFSHRANEHARSKNDFRRTISMLVADG